MSRDEKQLLKAAIGTLADPRGNWVYGWRLLCEMVELDPEQTRPAFTIHDAPGTPEQDGRKSQEASRSQDKGWWLP